jgi:hypothetical protein
MQVTAAKKTGNPGEWNVAVHVPRKKEKQSDGRQVCATQLLIFSWLSRILQHVYCYYPESVHVSCENHHGRMMYACMHQFWSSQRTNSGISISAQL